MNNNNNNQLFKVLSGKENVYIENTKSQQVICIERSYYSIRPLVDYTELIEAEIIDLKNVDSLLGIIDIDTSKYLLVIWQYRPVCQVLDIEIKSITEVDLILLSHTESNSNSKETLRKHLKRVLSKGFYYSNGCDITRSLQEKEELSMRTKRPFHSIRNCNRDFMWNHHLIQSFFTYNIDESFLSCCIYGYVTALNHSIQSVPCQFTLISKRLTYQFTIYNKDIGLMELNSNSNNGNTNKIYCHDFIETECITQLKANIFSFKICSSTIPIYYNQNKSRDITYKHLVVYLNDLLSKYNKLAMVNMINSKMQEEIEIKNTLDHMIKSYSNNDIKYLDIDTLGLIDCDIFVQNNANLCDFLCIYGRYLDKLILQKGVFYLLSNNTCNTKNDFMKALSWYYFNKQLELSGIGIGKGKGKGLNNNTANPQSIDLLSNSTDINDTNIVNINATTPHTSTLSIDKDKDALMTLFHEKWINHKIALEYERNPPATNNHISIINQRTLDYISDDNSIKRKYIQNKSINIFVGSWNSAGIDLSSSFDLTDWFINNFNKKTNENYFPDIIVIGMQEIVELNASNILINSNEEKVRQWKGLIYKGITNAFPNEEYIPIKDLHLVGILFICFTKKGINPIIKQSIINKTGAYGTMGNKGSCLISIIYHNSSIAFATGHFSAGEKSNDNRLSQMNEILNMQLIDTSNEKIHFRKFDHWFIFGDVNFRVEREYDDAMRHIQQNDIDYLLKYDQFLSAKNSTHHFNDVCEGHIQFPPTFKYVIGSDEFDRSKMRTPSWCDRIFYKASNDVKLLEYNSVNKIKYSDHKPVYAIFDLNCTQSIENEKTIILEEIKSHDEACNQNSFTVENSFIDINKFSQNNTSSTSSINPNNKINSVNLLGL